MRGTDIVGFSFGGEIFCPSHKPEVPEEELAPIFVSEVGQEDFDDICSVCDEFIMEHELDPDRGYKEARDERTLEEK